MALVKKMKIETAGHDHVVCRSVVWEVVLRGDAARRRLKGALQNDLPRGDLADGGSEHRALEKPRVPEEPSGELPSSRDFVLVFTKSTVSTYEPTLIFMSEITASCNNLKLIVASSLAWHGTICA